MPASDGLGNRIIRNGATLYNVHTEAIEQTLLMDESNTDHIGNHVRIVATGSIVQGDPTTIGLGISAGTGLQNAQQVLEAFNSTRGWLQYFVGNQALFSIWSSEDFNSRNPLTFDWKADIEDGPKVEATVLRVDGGDAAMRMRVTIEFTYLPCSPQVNRLALSPIVSLKWWMADDIDGNTWLTRRVYRGNVRLINREISPQSARYLVMPPLQIGFKRQSIQYDEAPDNRSMEWAVMDEEVYIQPPFPASEFSGESKVLSGLPSAGVQGLNQGTVDLTLGAPKNIDKKWLLHLLVYMMDTKTNFLHKITGFKCFVQRFSFTEMLHENKVGSSMHVIYQASDGGDVSQVLYKIINNTFGQRFNSTTIPGIGSAPPYDPQAPTYALPGTHTLVGIFIPMLQTPCSPNTSFTGGVFQPPSDEPNPDDGSGELPPQDGSGDNAVGPNPNLGFTNSPQVPYMQYKISQKYRMKSGWKQYPTAFGSDENNSSAIVNQHRAMATKYVTFEASRVNDWPVVPGPYGYTEQNQGAGINHTVLDYELDTNSAVPSADGDALLYTTAGYLELGMARPYKDTEALTVPRAPNVGQSVNLGNDPTKIVSMGANYRLALNNNVFTQPGGQPGIGGDGGTGSNA